MAHICSEGDCLALDSRDFDLESQEEENTVSRARDYWKVCHQYRDTCELGSGEEDKIIQTLNVEDIKGALTIPTRETLNVSLEAQEDKTKFLTALLSFHRMLLSKETQTEEYNTCEQSPMKSNFELPEPVKKMTLTKSILKLEYEIDEILNIGDICRSGRTHLLSLLHQRRWSAAKSWVFDNLAGCSTWFIDTCGRENMRMGD